MVQLVTTLGLQTAKLTNNHETGATCSFFLLQTGLLSLGIVKKMSNNQEKGATFVTMFG